MPKVDRLFSLLAAVFDLSLDAWRFICLSLQPRCTLAAENLFLRKRLALYLERHVEPRRTRAAAKLTLVVLRRKTPDAINVPEVNFWRSKCRASWRAASTRRHSA